MNIFLDCGYYIGDALKQYLDNNTVDGTWTIYAFEPNPEVDLDGATSRFNVEIKQIKKAVWIKNGKVPFWISDRHNASHVDDTTYNARKTQIEVPSMNFSKFVSKLPDDAYVICSMDIEGSEYRVLEQMIKDGTIDRIDLLDIEFHHRFMADYDSGDSQKLIDELEKRGVKVKLKVDLV